MQEIVKYRGQNCYNPTSVHCFIKCINCFANKDYTENSLTLIWSEKYRSGVRISARIQPFCRKYDINIGCFDGTRINPRNTTQKNTALKIHNNHFCLLWKSNGINFIQVRRKS